MDLASAVKRSSPSVTATRLPTTRNGAVAGEKRARLKIPVAVKALQYERGEARPGILRRLFRVHRPRDVL
jgi:hypothetical protein